ncbi:MAG: ornithine carbamoyltransferase [Candidatus Omnitrophica bacterium]|nr:ornithine carbamoyltransferase [Candidatus Omnitrophota bacterium]
MNKDLISGFDLSEQDIENIFSLTSKLKKKKMDNCLKNKTIGLVFQKPSVRTRVSFEVGARQLGANCLYLAPHDIELGSREPLKDVARVLCRYLDGIIARTFAHEHVIELAKYADIPVINGLSDLYHPAQALADIYTIWEQGNKLKGVKLVYIGDGNNVVNSLLAICAKVGMDFTVATPKGYEPNKQIWSDAQKIAKQNKSKLIHCYDPKVAVKCADFIYSDVWTSMGQEKEAVKRIKVFKPYQINAELLKSVGKQYKIMHCMPIHRGQEMTDEVVESEQSIIFDQAENRMHVQKAVMALLLGSKSKVKS